MKLIFVGVLIQHNFKLFQARDFEDEDGHLLGKEDSAHSGPEPQRMGDIAGAMTSFLLKTICVKENQ